MSDERFRVLTGAALGAVAIIAVTVLLAVGIDPLKIAGGFSVVGSILSFFVLSEVQKVKQQTNGTQTELIRQLEDERRKNTELTAQYAEYAKNSAPLPKVGVKSGG